ncbi:hypothetical protein, partial [Streptomyces sp. NPDC058623]|uniref:hypothetical protein n=1 Tax=Streptomyces sp. NPDC058623 TaxID=3346563 RepID=UPI003658154A
MILGGASPALAEELPGGSGEVQKVVDEPLVADGAAIEPGSITDEPASAGEPVLDGIESIDELEEDAEVPGQALGADRPDPVFTGVDDISSPTGQYCGSPFNTVHIIRNTKNTMAVKYTTFVTNNTSSTQKFK